MKPLPAKGIFVCFLFLKAGPKVGHKSCAETICLGKGFPTFCKASVPIPPTYIPGLRENKITSAGRSAVTQVEIQEHGKGLQENSTHGKLFGEVLHSLQHHHFHQASLRSILSLQIICIIAAIKGTTLQ